MPYMIQLQSPAKDPHIALNKCFLLQVTSEPQIGILPDDINIAYIRYDNKLYYSNPARNQLEVVPKMTQELLEKFDLEMGFSTKSAGGSNSSVSVIASKILSKKDLNKIRSFMGYIPPPDPTRSIPICKFVEFSDSDQIVWTNIKYDVSIKFSFNKIKDLLKKFLGLTEDSFNKLVFQAENSHGTPVEYHGTINKDQKVNANQVLCNGVINALIARNPENALFKGSNGDYFLYEVGVNLGSFTREYKLILINSKKEFDTTTPEVDQIFLFWDKYGSNAVEYSVMDLDKNIKKGNISRRSFSENQLERSKWDAFFSASWTLKGLAPSLDAILTVIFKKDRSLFTGPTYHNDAKHVEIKFALKDHTNTRVIVNIHFSDDLEKENVDSAVIELDKLIDLVKKPEIMAEIKIAEQISLLNFKENDYFVAPNSLDKYRSILPEYLRAELSKEKYAGRELQRKISNLEEELKAQQEKTTQQSENFKNVATFFKSSITKNGENFELKINESSLEQLKSVVLECTTQ